MHSPDAERVVKRAPIVVWSAGLMVVLSVASCHRDCRRSARDHSAEDSGAASNEASSGDDPIALGADEPVGISSTLIDLEAVPAEAKEMTRARLWIVRKGQWGWAGFSDAVAKIAAQEPKAAIWFKIEHEGKPVLLLTALDGKLEVAPVDVLKGDLVEKKIARDATDAARLVEVLGPDRESDASIAALEGREREVEAGRLVAPFWPDTTTLESGEFVPAGPFRDQRVEGSYLLPERHALGVEAMARTTDKSMSNIAEQCYLLARSQIAKAKKVGDLPRLSTGAPNGQARAEMQSVFLVFPAWMALEIERRAHDLDASKSTIIAAAISIGLPQIEKP